MSMIKTYFSLLKEYREKYGLNTFLLMQVGSFFEVYSMTDNDENMNAFSNLCDLKIAAKGDHYMAGFRDYMLEKYISKINESNYTTVVYIQEEVGGVIRRKEYAVFSPGTTFVDDEVKLSNNTSCLWIHKTKRSPNLLIFGIANIDIYTGMVHSFEYQELFYHNPTTYDSIEKFVAVYNPMEFIVIHNLENDMINSILQFINLKSKKVTKINLQENEILSKQAKKCESQVYQTEIIKKFYPFLNTQILMDNLFEKIISFQSLCFLLDFISQHNPGLTKNLSEPCLEKSQNNLILANHSLKQLNIIDNEEYQGEYSSVHKLLNTCRTKIGKREFKRLLLNPTRNVKELNLSYDMIDYCLKHKYDTSEYLVKLCDIEKIYRKIILEKATPHEYYLLHETCEVLLNSFENYDEKWNEYMLTDITKNDIYELNKIISSTLNIYVAKNLNELDENCDNLIFHEVDLELDEICKKKIESKSKFESIIKYLNDTYNLLDKKTTDAFKIHETDKNGISIQITKRRKSIIEKRLSVTKDIELNFFSKFSNQNENFIFKPSSINFSEYNTTTLTIDNSDINELTQLMLKTNYMFLTHLNRVFKLFHSKMNLCYDNIIKTIRLMDVMNTKCEVSKKYNYCKPIIEDSEKSFLKASSLRHCLIEHIEKNEAYVSNDIELGTSPQGMLLFGTNAVGKTSLIKAIGICVIMAQAGLYVPCNSFVYQPYQYLFTRIIGNDNLFKGLSTFAVEMSELRVILQQCNSTSLILGDELCSGTEIDSALSIFVAGLEKMYDKKSSFIFATHFHSIQYFDELKSMENISMKHLTVSYNYELKKLIYGRKLCDGAGESVYGLEVCKSLSLPDDFLDRAYKIRNKYNNITTSVLDLKQSTYNKDKLRNICEICKTSMGTEIHHLKYQKIATNDYVDSMYIHHPANLASICEKCHQDIHKNNKIYEKRKTLNGESVLVKTEK
jgi:DNA mismatch repair protein MutS